MAFCPLSVILVFCWNLSAPFSCIFMPDWQFISFSLCATATSSQKAPWELQWWLMIPKSCFCVSVDLWIPKWNTPLLDFYYWKSSVMKKHVVNAFLQKFENIINSVFHFGKRCSFGLIRLILLWLPTIRQASCTMCSNGVALILLSPLWQNSPWMCEQY